MKYKPGHLVNTLTNEWFHVDERNRLWTCPCTEGHAVSLCITVDESLSKKGVLRDLERAIAMKRKDLGLKPGDPMPQI